MKKLFFTGKQNSFVVDCSRGGSNVLFVGVYGPDTPCDEVRPGAAATCSSWGSTVLTPPVMR